jgi:hypothetical protein
MPNRGAYRISPSTVLAIDAVEVHGTALSINRVHPTERLACVTISHDRHVLRSPTCASNLFEHPHMARETSALQLMH